MNKLFKVLLTLSAVLILAVPTLARDWYVDKANGTNGAGRDGSISQPFQTITYAISRASAYDRILVDAWSGSQQTYNERVVIPSGKNNLTIEGLLENSTMPFLDGTGATPTSTPACGFNVQSDNVTIKNFSIRNFRAATSATDFTNNNEGGAGVYNIAGSSGHTYINLQVYYCNWGIYLNETSKSTVKACTIGASAITGYPNANIITDNAGNGGVGVMCYTTGVTIEKNMIGGPNPEDGNMISYCDTFGIKLGYGQYGQSSGRSADQTVIRNNTIEYIGDLVYGSGFGIGIFNVLNTVNVLDNTVANCANGMSIAGRCLDLNVANNNFQDCGSVSNVIIQAYNSGSALIGDYGGDFLFDIWKNNENGFMTGDVYNSAAAVDKTTNTILISRETANLMFIRPKIQPVWDIDAQSFHRLGVKGYDPRFTTIGTATDYVYTEQITLTSGTISDVEVYGENDAHPEYTVITAPTTGSACASSYANLSIEAVNINLHGFLFQGLAPASDRHMDAISVNSTGDTIAYNQFKVTNTSSSYGTSCFSWGIRNVPFGDGGLDVAGLYIHNNSFTHYGTPAATILGYGGIAIYAFDNAEAGNPDDIRIIDNTFGGQLYQGVLVQQGGVTVERNTFTTSLALSANSTLDNGEGNYAIYVHDPNNGGTQDDVTIRCNTISGTGGFLSGIQIGQSGQSIDVSVTSNVINNCYAGINVLEALAIGNGVVINNNNLAGPYGYAALWMQEVDPGETVDAQNNWWGGTNQAGPNHDLNSFNKPNQGARIIDPSFLVDFVPWWGEAPTGTCPLVSTSSSIAPVTLRDGGTEAWVSDHTSITSAIRAADGTNYIIWAVKGDYYESLDISDPGAVLTSGLQIKGKRSNGISNAWSTGTTGCYDADAPSLYPYNNTTMVQIGIDGVEISGFKFRMDQTYNSINPTVGVLFNSSTFTGNDNAVLQYNCFFMDANDNSVLVNNNTNGVNNLTLAYNKFNGPSATANAQWFQVNGNGFGNGFDINHNEINYASAYLKLGSGGNIDNPSFTYNTFNNTAGGLVLGTNLATPATVFSNVIIQYNTFNHGSFNEFALLLVNNAALAGSGFFALALDDFNGSDLFNNLLFNYNVVNMIPTTYRTVGFSASINPNSGGNDFGDNINAETNFWGSIYGPKVAVVSYNITNNNYFWDQTNDGNFTGWPRQRSSWNQSMQGPASAENWNVDFFPWAENAANALAGINYDGPITVVNGDGSGISYHPSFWDAIASAEADDGGSVDYITMASGTYTEDFGVYKNGIEIRGNNSLQSNYNFVTSGIYGILLQRPAATGPVDNIWLHGLTFNSTFSGARWSNITVNGTNLLLNHNIFNTSDLGYGRSVASMDYLFAATNQDIAGLTVEDNIFNINNVFGSFWLSNNGGAWASESVFIRNNTFSGANNNDFGVLYFENIPWLVIEGNTFDAGTGSYVYDIYFGNVDNSLISCNSFTSADSHRGINITSGSSNNTIKNNIFRNKAVALNIESDAASQIVMYNDFNTNTLAIALNEATNLTAENNYFGSHNGPTHASNPYNVGDQGTPISWAGGGIIDYAPWWIDFVSDCPNDASGTSFIPVKVYDDAAYTSLRSSHVSISDAINYDDVANGTQNGWWVVAEAGTYTENLETPGTQTINTPVVDLYFDTNNGPVVVDGNLTLGNTSDLTMIGRYTILGDMYFAGPALQSSVVVLDNDFQVNGELYNASSPLSVGPWDNVIFTEGTGYFARGMVGTDENVSLPVHAPVGSNYPYFFPVNVKIGAASITDGIVKARVDGENPVDNFQVGERANPINNTWYLQAMQSDNTTPLVNPDADVVFFYPDALSLPDGFDETTLANTEVNGCWDEAEVMRNAFGAKWLGSEWQSYRNSSPSIGGLQTQVIGLNDFSPWGVFWGYSDAPLVDMPDHADNLQFIDVGTDFLKIRVSRGTGDRFAVIVKPGADPLDCWTCFPGQPAEYPIDGIDYTLSPYNVGSNLTNAIFTDGRLIGDNGARIVYMSDPNGVDENRQVTITNLNHGTKYFIQVIELNGAGEGTNYNDRGWCNLDVDTQPTYNGRSRMTVPIVYLTFDDGTLQRDVCNQWNGQYLRISPMSSGESPWNVKYSNGQSTIDAGLVYSNNPLIDAPTTTTSRTYSLVLVKDAGQRLCEVQGNPVLTVHTPTTYASGNEVTVSPSPACVGASVTFTPNVSGSDAIFDHWTVDYDGAGGNPAVTLATPTGSLTSGTTYSINTTTGVLTINTAALADNGDQFVVYFTGSATCNQLVPVGSPIKTLNVNAGPVAGTLASNPAMPVCSNSGVILTLSGQNATNWTWQRSTNNQGTWNDVVTNTSTTFSIPAGDVTAASGKVGGAGRYWYRVIAHRPGCADATSAAFGLETIQAPNDWSSNDAGIARSSASAGSLSITWNTPPVGGGAVDHYVVNAYRISPTTATMTGIQTSTNSLTLGAPWLQDCAVYQFDVRAYNACNNANTLSATSATIASYCPTIILTPSSPTFDFGNVYVGATSSTTFSYTVEGRDLSTDVTLTLPSTDFQVAISQNGTTYSAYSTSAQTLLRTWLNTSGNKYYIKVIFVPQAANTYTNALITHSTTGATTKYATVSGVGVNNSPTLQVSNLCVADLSDMNDQTGTLSWTGGNGAGRIVLISPNDTWASPGTSNHAAGTTIGDDYVVYNGSGTTASFNLTTIGISAGTKFYVKAYEYNTSGGLYYYNVSGSAQFPKWLVFTTQPASGTDLNSGSGFNVVVTSRYRDNTTYAAGAGNDITLSLGIENGAGSISPTVATLSGNSGNTGTVAVTWTAADGASPAQMNATYSACSWFKGVSNEWDIIPSTPSQQTRTIIITGFANCGGGNVDVLLRATTGNGAHRIIVIKQGAYPSTPVDGTIYTDANGDYTTAPTMTNDASSYVMDRDDYSGSGENRYYTLYDVPTNTTFYFRAYEYNGNASGITKYNTSMASFNPIGRTTPSCKTGAGDFYVDADGLNVNSYNKKAFVSWNTSIEQGILGYELYRADVNSTSSEYTLVGSYLADEELVGGLNSYALRSYNFVDGDQRLVVGNEYIYRLVATAIDGSKIDIGDQVVTITDLTNPYAKFEIANVNPNPAVDNIKFDITLNAEQNVTVEILDLNGKVVSTPVVNKMYNIGSHTISISLGDVASGTYMLHVTTGYGSALHKITVIR